MGKYDSAAWGNPHIKGQVYPDLGCFDEEGAVTDRERVLSHPRTFVYYDRMQDFGPGFNDDLFPCMTKCLFMFQEGDEYLGEVTVDNDHSQSA